MLFRTLLCTYCVTPAELADWPLWALVSSLKKGRNAPTCPPRMAWRELHGRGFGNGSVLPTGKTLARVLAPGRRPGSCPGLGCQPDVQPPHLALRLAPSKH